MKQVHFISIPEIQLYKVKDSDKLQLDIPYIETTIYKDDFDQSIDDIDWNVKLSKKVLEMPKEILQEKISTIILNQKDFNKPYTKILWKKVFPDNPYTFVLTSRQNAIDFFIKIIDIITIEYNTLQYIKRPTLIKYSNIYAATAWFLQVKCDIYQGVNTEDLEYAKCINGFVGFEMQDNTLLTIKELYIEIDNIFPQKNKLKHQPTIRRLIS